MALRTRPDPVPRARLAASPRSSSRRPAGSSATCTGFAVQPNKAIVGRQRLRPRERHPPGRGDQEPADLRDHDPPVRRADRQPADDRQAVRPARPPGQAARARPRGRGRAARHVYRAAIALADAKKEVTDDDLLALVEQNTAEVPASVVLEGWSVTSSHGGKATGTVILTVAGQERSAEATGNGPVNALYGAVDKAIEPVLGWTPILSEYEIKAVSAGEDAQGQILVRCRRSTDTGPGRSP